VFYGSTSSLLIPEIDHTSAGTPFAIRKPRRKNRAINLAGGDLAGHKNYSGGQASDVTMHKNYSGEQMESSSKRPLSAVYKFTPPPPLTLFMPSKVITHF